MLSENGKISHFNTMKYDTVEQYLIVFIVKIVKEYAKKSCSKRVLGENPLVFYYNQSDVFHLDNTIFAIVHAVPSFCRNTA